MAGLLESRSWRYFCCSVDVLLLCTTYGQLWQQAHLLIKHDFPVPTSPMEMTLMRTTLLRAVPGSPPILLGWGGQCHPGGA